MGLKLGTHRALLGGKAGLPTLDYNLALDTFTAAMGTRAGSVFAGAPIAQGKADGTGTPDVLSIPRGDQMGNPTQYAYRNFDPYQGAISFWITPEWDGDIGYERGILDAAGAVQFRLRFTLAGNLNIVLPGGQVNVDTTAWTAGTVYNVILRWNSKTPIDGTNYACLSVDDVHTFGVTSSWTPAVPLAAMLLGNEAGSIRPANALIEGLTVYRRVLFDGTYGDAPNFDASGPIDELAAIYNAGTGKDPCLVTGSWDVCTCVPTNSTVGALTTGTGDAWSHPHGSEQIDVPFLDDGGLPGTPYAVEFNGTTTIINCGSDNSLDDLPDGANGFQAGAWVRLDSTDHARIFSKSVVGSGWYLYYRAGRGLAAYVYCATANASSWSGDSYMVVPDGEFHFVLASFKSLAAGGDGKIYLAIDGRWVGSYLQQIAEQGAYQSDAAENLYQGSSGDWLFLDGAIAWSALWDDVTTYPVGTDFIAPRTPPGAGGNLVEEWPMDEGTGATCAATVTSPANDGTITDGEWESVWAVESTPVVPYSLEFFEENDGIAFAGGTPNIDNLFLADCTIELWVRISPEASGNQSILSKCDPTPTLGWQIATSSLGRVLFQAKFATNDIYKITSTQGLFDDIWHHYAVDWDQGTLTARVFWDGILKGTDTAVGAYQADAAKDCLVNARNAIGTADGPFAIGPIRLSNTRRYTGNSFVPPDRITWVANDANAHLLCDMRDGAGTTVTDSSGNGYDGTVTFGATTRWNTTPDMPTDEPGKRIYNNGYSVGSDGANDGMSTQKTLLANTDYAVRASIQYGADCRGQPVVQLYDETAPAVLNSLTGPLLVATHDGGDGSVDFTDTGEFYPASLIGGTIYNITDGSSGTITGVSGTNQDTIETTLSGGTDDDFDNGDVVRIVPPDGWVWAETFVARTGANTACSVRILNAAGEGVLSVHQVENLVSELDHGDHESLTGGNPDLITGWVNAGLDAGDTEAEAVVVHSGSQSLEWNPGASSERMRCPDTVTATVGAFYAFGASLHGDGSAEMSLRSGGGVRAVLQGDPAIYYYSSPVDAVWLPLAVVMRALNVAPRWCLSSGAGASGDRYSDDIYVYALDPVNLTVTPASAANSLEGTGRRVDGTDTDTQTVSKLPADKGRIKFSALPRHVLSDMNSFGQDREYLIDIRQDANNRIEVFRVLGGVVLQVESGGTTYSGVWAGTWDAGTALTVDVRYKASWGEARLYLGGELRATASLDSAFDTAWDASTAYFGSSYLGTYQFDGVIAAYEEGEDGGTDFVPADIPQAEADALVAFYSAYGGFNWTNNSNWLADATVNNWYGIIVAGGHVTEIDLQSNNLSGGAVGVLDPLAASLTNLSCYNNNIKTLDVSELTSLTNLQCYSNNITTLDVSELTSLTYLRCSSNNITTLDVSELTSLTYLRCYNNSITTLDVSALTSLTYLRCASNSITVLDVSNISNAVSYINASGNGMALAAVDQIITDVWNNRANWTDATPELHVGGTNVTPTGAYQDGYPAPLDELEMVHDLINDDDGAGIRTWAAISWNGGSAP